MLIKLLFCEQNTIQTNIMTYVENCGDFSTLYRVVRIPIMPNVEIAQREMVKNPERVKLQTIDDIRRILKGSECSY